MELVAPRPVASASSFDLVPLDDGAVLGWSSPPPDARISVIALGPLGEARGSDVLVSERLAIELAMASEGGRMALAWVSQSSHRSMEIVAEAAFAPGGVGSFSAPIGLGISDPLITPHRGRLALATADDGAFYVSHRLPIAPCTSGLPSCTLMGRRRLDLPDAMGRGDEPLEVPGACEPFIAGTIGNHGTWFSALCHEVDGAPVTTVYAIRPSLSLAAANEMLPGCAPRALVPTAGGAALIGECADGVGVAWQDELGRVVGDARAATLTTTCVDGRPVLGVAGTQSLSVPLTAPVARIEGLLPPEVASSDARAVWTGSSILVARHRALGAGHGEVALARFQCVDDRFTRTDL